MYLYINQLTNNFNYCFLFAFDLNKINSAFAKRIELKKDFDIFTASFRIGLLLWTYIVVQ